MENRLYFELSPAELDSLLMMVPSTIALPTDPIGLTKQQQETLFKLICNEIGDVPPRVLRSVTVDAALQPGRHDRSPALCDVQHLRNVLKRYQLKLGESTFKLVVSQCVDPRIVGAINYEQFVDYLGKALDFQNSGYAHRLGSMTRERMVAHLMGEVRNAMIDQNYFVDPEVWSAAFEREREETLSGTVIRDISVQQRLPLTPNLIGKILKLVEDPSGNGKYRWRSFLEFLLKAMPKTPGLHQKAISHRRREASPDRSPIKSYEHKDYVYDQRGRDASPFREPDAPKDHRHEHAHLIDAADPRFHHLSQKITSIEERNAIAKQSLLMKDRPWLDRFMKMAAAMYDRDHATKGALPPDEVMEILTLYNMAFDLGYDEDMLQQFVKYTGHFDRYGHIIIQHFLWDLQKRRGHVN